MAKKQEREEYINYLEPLLAKFENVYGNKDWSKARNHAIAVALAGALATVTAFFFPLGDWSWVWVFVGVALGIGLFIPTWFALRQFAVKKQSEDPEFESLKQSKSPAQRARIGIVSFVIMLVVMTIVLGTLPQIAGGIVAVAGSLGIYAFIQRTPEEFDAYIEGEVDPRDIDEDIDEEPIDEQAGKAEAYENLVNSLTDEQKALLLNSELKGLMTVQQEDDKNKSKKGLFRRG